jgi:hypothetical protein
MPTIKKTGEKISWKEALIRFKKGVDEITPMQKLSNDIRGTFITLLGYLFAMGAVIWKFNTIGLLSIGLILIFLGSVVTTGLKWIALKQQYKFIKNLDLESEEEILMKDIKELKEVN